MKLGIVGCGRVVEEGHAPALASLADLFDVHALVDPSEERRNAAAAELGGSAPRGYPNLTSMLAAESLDAVVVAVPHDLHEQTILEVLASGVDVISEKPLAVTLDAIDRIAAELARSGTRISVMHNWQYNPDAVAALAAIDRGRIGTPVLVRNENVWGAPWESKDATSPHNWRLSLGRSGGGIVMDGAYHAFYMAERELRNPVIRVFASLGSFGAGAEVEDTATVVLDHEDGGTAVIERCWLARGGGVGVHEVHGTEGSLRFQQLDPQVMTHIFKGDYSAAAESSGSPQGPSLEIFENSKGDWEPLEVAEPHTEWWSGIREIYKLTHECWSAGTDAPVGIVAARRNVAIVQAAYLSAERKAVVELAELDPPKDT